MDIIEFILKEKWHLHFAVGTVAVIIGVVTGEYNWSFVLLLIVELYKEYLDTLNMGRWCPDRSIPDIIFTMLPFIIYSLIKHKNNDKSD